MRVESADGTFAVEVSLETITWDEVPRLLLRVASAVTNASKMAAGIAARSPLPVAEGAALVFEDLLAIKKMLET